MTQHEAGGSGAWHEQLRSTLETVGDLYRQLGALSRRLITGIENGEIEELLDLLDERGACVGLLEDISLEYEAGLAAFERSSSTLSSVERTELMGRITQIQHDAASLAEADAEAAGLLEAHRGRISSEMSALGHKSAAVAAYAGGRSAGTVARFQDREG